MIIFLEVYLKEESNIIKSIENKRVIISIENIEINIERILKSALKVIKSTVKVTL